MKPESSHRQKRSHKGERAPATAQRANARRSSLISLGVAFVVALGLIALVHALTTGSTQNATTASTTSRGEGGTGAAASSLAPAFTLNSLAGKPFTLASARGHPVVLYFMATTCSSCVHGSWSVAQAVETAHIAGARAVIIDVNASDTPADLEAFIQSTGVTADAPVVWGVDTNNRIAQAYDVLTLETTVVVDAQGRIAFESPGEVAWQQLYPIIQQAA